MKTRRLFATIIMLIALVGVTAYANDGNENPMESLYGEWRLVGWSDEGSWFEVNTNYVGHHRLSIEIPKEGRVVAYSMANEIFLGTLTLNGNELIFGGGAMTMIGFDKYENLFFEDHIIEIKSYKLNGNSLRLYYTDEDYFLFTKYFDVSADYFPQGTKWTEIRLDTLKYDSWYSKVGDDWVPNFETIEYNVKGTITTANTNWEYPTYKCVYSNSQEWTDSLTLLISERRDYYESSGVYVTVPVITPNGNTPGDAQAYFFNWEVGYPIFYNDLYDMYNQSGTTYNGEIFGTIEEVKEGDFGGVRPLKYTDVNGVRFIDGIGATEWNDGECIFGLINPYQATAYLKNKIFNEETLPSKVRHYRSMLVHFESNDEVLYNVWPEKPENSDISDSYFPEGTKWTEIRLDTLKYDSWYSKVGDEWVPNFETIEYNVKGEYVEKVGDERRIFKTVYTNGPEWADSLTLMLWEGIYGSNDKYVFATIPPIIEADGSSYVLWPAEAYHFDWNIGKMIKFKDIISSNATAIYPPNKFDFGKIGEIKEGEFGGARSLKYADVNGVRIIQGIGVTTWNDGECLFGPVKPYDALRFFGPSDPDIILDRNEYRSMLVHFESNGEVLYDVWPEKPENLVTFTQGQMATIILPTDPNPELGKYYRLDRREDGKIIFEEELAPKAHVPYIIMPKKDFNIDLGTLDLEGCYRDSVSADGITFIGSFVSEEIDYAENCYIDIIDITIDCREDDFCIEKNIVGALRAFLRVDTNWEDPFNPGGTRSMEAQKKLPIVLHDHETSIASTLGETSKGAIYNLSGRKMFNELKKGIYIQDGKKILIK